jgi:hypothetical protein
MLKGAMDGVIYIFTPDVRKNPNFSKIKKIIFS